MGCSKPL
ncbi:hypothetical protein F383_22708 [Gossypium arboreum]|nr:hypothetical protein F383_22708 [Gossypium arboreum]